MYLEKNSHLEISLLCIVCDRDKIKEISDILEKQKTFFNLLTLGKGTASSKILNYLGLGETDKAIFFCVLLKDSAYQINERLDKKLQFTKPGHGISFIAQICGGCYHKPVEFVGKENGEIVMHNLIIVVLNRGYSEDVMKAAKTAGATGGTVFHARGCGTEQMEKFFGMIIAPEKEVIMIVTEESTSTGIMTSIAEKTGHSTEAGAVSFSIPIKDVKGFNTNQINPQQ